MQKARVYITVLVAVTILYSLIVWIAPEKIDWKLSLDPNDKGPYGTYVLKNSLEDLFPNSEISEFEENYYFLNEEGYEDNINLIVINNYSSMSSHSLDELFEFIERGNTVFYSSHNISSVVLDSFDINNEFYYASYNNKSEYFPLQLDSEQYSIKDSTHYKYSYFHYLQDFDGLDSCGFNYEILGNIYDEYYTNFVRIDIGEGHLFLHSSPIAFTNYNILKGYTDTYTEDVFSKLPQQNTYLDISSSKISSQSKSFFNVIFKYRALKMAYIIFLIIVILYIVTNAFRKQRLIPIFNPPKNSSLELVDSVAELYIHQRDHKNLSDKIIRHFYDYLQQHYYLSPTIMDDRFVEKLSSKSGKSIGDIKELAGGIQNIKNAKNVSDADLMKLCGIIEDFKK